MLRQIILCMRNLHQIEPAQRMLSYERESSAQFKEPIASEFNLEQIHIDEAIKLAPTLASASPELWRKSHETFINHGLKTINFLQIVTGNPAIINRQTDKIIHSLEIWRSCQFGEKILFLLITKYPTLLNITDGDSLLDHITFLKGYVATNKNVWKLLMNSPDIMGQSQQCITEKFKYITEKMRIFVPEIVKSCALSKSIDEIRCRHVFLDRLGLFKPRPLKSNPDEPTKNHRLYQIVDTSDKAFATKICHVSLMEFEAFQELFRREMDRNIKSDAFRDESDDDAEDDEDE